MYYVLMIFVVTVVVTKVFKHYSKVKKFVVGVSDVTFLIWSGIRYVSSSFWESSRVFRISVVEKMNRNILKMAAYSSLILALFFLFLYMMIFFTAIPATDDWKIFMFLMGLIGLVAAILDVTYTHVDNRTRANVITVVLFAIMGVVIYLSATDSEFKRFMVADEARLNAMLNLLSPAMLLTMIGGKLFQRLRKELTKA